MVDVFCVANDFTFNSLSRDHESVSPARVRASALSFQLPLSGSQLANEQAATMERLQAFNSLSRDHRASRRHRASSQLEFFQLPLSGSRNPSKSALTRGTDPFNSLSRDHTTI